MRQFVLNAAQRIGLSITAERKQAGAFRIAVGPEAIATVPDAVRFALPASRDGRWLVSFASPEPEGAEYLGRNHPFVSALARFLMEEAMTMGGRARASRCGVIRTRAVSRLTTILLLRVRYLLNQPDRVPLLAEEVVVAGYGLARGAPEWLTDGEALTLLSEARPDANIPMPEKRELAAAALAAWPTLASALEARINARAADLERSHKRVRQAVALGVRGLTVSPQLPPDLLGILVLQPLVE